MALGYFLASYLLSRSSELLADLREVCRCCGIRVPALVQMVRRGRFYILIFRLCIYCQLSDCIFCIENMGKIDHRPNQSPEPTAVGAGRSAVAVRAASRRWLSFFR